MDADYLPVERVAQLLAVSTRHAHRACHKANVRTSKAGKRTLYHRLDVEQLAVELGADYRHVETATAPNTEPSTALVPYDALQRKLTDMERKLDERERVHQSELAQIQRTLSEQNRMLTYLIKHRIETETPVSEPEPEAERLPWWRRLFARIYSRL